MIFSLVGSFNLSEGYLGGAKALEKLGHKVLFIPASKYKNDDPDGFVNTIIQDLQIQNPNIVLWWRAEGLDHIQFSRVRKALPKSIKFILFSWDDPLAQEKHPEMPFKCKYLDVAFTCCMGSIPDYQNNGCKGVYCPPGFDPEVHYPETDSNFICDISLVCTNYYNDPNITTQHHINRKALMQEIISKCPDLDIRLYGIESFHNDFPDHYKGWIDFKESRKIFTNSKISLNTHIRPDGDMYINERVAQILGSKGLLFMDHVKGIEKNFEINKECLIMDWNPKKVVTQIRQILENYSEYEHIKEDGYKKALEKLTWNNWAQTIINNI